MPTAILLGVTGVSRRRRARARRAGRLLRPAAAHPGPAAAPSCSGTWSADVAVAVALTVPILALGLHRSACASRPGRSACSCSSSSPRCGASRSPGFGYAIALKTGNPAAVNSSFLLFFPFLFLTSSYVPRDAAVRGWLDTVAGWNPVTYLLEGMRSLVIERLGVGRARRRRCSPSPSSAPSACRCASPPSGGA